jgi:predicted transposase YbfD/YdcC
LEQGADVLLTVKSNQKTLYRQIGCQFQGKRHIPFVATDHEKRHGRDTAWELRAREAPEHIKANWPGSAWIVEVITDTLTRKGKRKIRHHLFLTSVRTTPQALLHLIRQRWSIENEWHWARDAQLGEDAHRYANRIGAPVFALLRTIVMNLLRRGGYRSIRQGLRELAYDIKGMLALGGVTMAGTTT